MVAWDWVEPWSGGAVSCRHEVPLEGHGENSRCHLFSPNPQSYYLITGNPVPHKLQLSSQARLRTVWMICPPHKVHSLFISAPGSLPTNQLNERTPGPWLSCTSQPHHLSYHRVSFCREPHQRRSCIPPLVTPPTAIAHGSDLLPSLLWVALCFHPTGLCSRPSYYCSVCGGTWHK